MSESSLFYKSVNVKRVVSDKYTASITVEAAFVLPIIILTVFALIYLAFYLHDKSRIQGVIDLSLHKAGITVKHEAELSDGQVGYESISGRGVFFSLFGNLEAEEEQFEEYLLQELGRGLFLTRIKSINAEINKTKLTISVETKTEVNLPGMEYLFQPFTDRIITEEYSIHNPAETLRQTEVILETGSKIKGIEELKEKLQKFLGASN